MSSSPRTLKELALEVIRVQILHHSCLDLILYQMQQAAIDLRLALETEELDASNEAVAHHPIMQLWADKIAFLTGTQSTGTQSWGLREMGTTWSKIKTLASNE